MRITTIDKYLELREYFCSCCGVKVCTEIKHLKCIAACIYLASNYSDILEAQNENQ